MTYIDDQNGELEWYLQIALLALFILVIPVFVAFWAEAVFW